MGKNPMSFLNFNFQVLIYEDQNSKNPKIKIPDITEDLQQICVSSPKVDSFTIWPNEIQTIMATSRSLGINNTTQFSISRPDAAMADSIRLSYTGTGAAPNFRTDRNIGGGASTTVSIARLTPYVLRITNTGGTAWNTTAIQTGDYLAIEGTTTSFTSPFDPIYQNTTLYVQSKSSTYIDVVDNGGLPPTSSDVTLGADFAKAMRVFTQGPVREGDTVEISGSGIHPSNQGKFHITGVSTDYIEFVNPYAVEETFLYNANEIVVYDRLIGFVVIKGDGKFKIRTGGSQTWTVCDTLGQTSLYIASASTYQIQASNDGPDAVRLLVTYATVD